MSQGHVSHSCQMNTDRTRSPSIAHRAGVTYATSSLGKSSLFGGPTSLIAGLATTFRTGAAHALEFNAVIKPITALHIYIGRSYPYRAYLPGVSVSTQIATLRRLLLNGANEEQETGYWFKKAADVGFLVCFCFPYKC